MEATRDMNTGQAAVLSVSATGLAVLGIAVTHMVEKVATAAAENGQGFSFGFGKARLKTTPADCTA
ncbi:hypothetical protein C1879_10420 [Paraeggerthella hongkongensis]|nr:hypothetical protein C1879_10420 [Paraeggerthella hongkongensis]